MEVTSIIAMILSTAVRIIDNKDLVDAVLSSDELSPEAKERIKKWRKDVEEEWQSLLPKDE